MANRDIKHEIKNAGLKQWQIADKLKMQDSNFSKLLRKEVSAEMKQKIRYIITKLKKDGEK